MVKGKGALDKKRDRDASDHTERGSHRKSIDHEEAYETNDDDEDRGQASNPERSLNVSVIIDSVGIGGQANDDSIATTHDDPLPKIPLQWYTRCLRFSPTIVDVPVTISLHRECSMCCPRCPRSRRSEADPLTDLRTQNPEFKTCRHH